MSTVDDFIPAYQWRERALRAESQASRAMDCLKRLGSYEKIPEEWRDLIRAAYIGCDGVDWWKEHPPLLNSDG